MSAEEISGTLLPGAVICDEIAASLPSGYCLNVTFGGASTFNLTPAAGAELGFSSTRHVTFDPRGALNPDGFEEGRLCDEFMNKWGRSKGWSLEGMLYDSNNWRYLDPHYLIWKIWEERVTPKLDAQTRCGYILTGEGSPILVEGCTESDLPESFKLSEDELTRIADRIYPVRSEDWIRIFDGTGVLARFDQNNYAQRHLDAFVGREVAIRVADALEAAVGVVGEEIFTFFLSLSSSQMAGEIGRGMEFVVAAQVAGGALGM